MTVPPGFPATMYPERSVFNKESGVARAKVSRVGGSRAKTKPVQPQSFPFMDKLLKKNIKAPKSVDRFRDTRSTAYQATMHQESREAKRTKSRIGSYPLDPYDSVSLDKYV